MKNPHNDTELYLGGVTNRFATYTGNAVNDEPLKECTQAILTTLDKDMRRKQRKKYSAKVKRYSYVMTGQVIPPNAPENILIEYGVVEGNE